MNRQSFSPRLSLTLVLSLALLTLPACARPPVKKMAEADVAILGAKAAGAESRAPDRYLQAQRLFDRSILDVEAGDFELARRHAARARKVALEAEEAALRSAEIDRPEEEGLSPSAPAPLVLLEPSARPEEERKNGAAPGGPRPAERPSLAGRHRVVEGESLWEISGYPQVYNDPYLWPLLYRANRERISDPDLIYPGQVLEIARDPSPQAAAEASREARNRGPWSLWDRK